MLLADWCVHTFLNMCTGMYDLLYVSEEEKEDRVMENNVEKGKEMTKMRKETGEAREVKILAQKR